MSKIKNKKKPQDNLEAFKSLPENKSGGLNKKVGNFLKNKKKKSEQRKIR